MKDQQTNLNPLIDDTHERLGLVLHATGVGIWDWQIQTGELTFNERWASIIGYTVAELSPIKFETWSENVHPDDLKKAIVLIENHFSGKTDTYEIEARMKHKLGHYIWVFAAGKLIERYEDGKPKRMIGTHLDITERKTYEERLIVSSQLLNESQQIAKLGGWELNLKTGFLFWTDETFRIHDASPDTFNPSVDAGVDHFLPESKAIITKAIDDAINKGVGYDLELETYTTKGRKIDVRTTCTVTLEDGKAIRLAGIFQDITEQKSIQRKLQESNLELERANSQLQLSAHYDALTGLPNRNLLADRMQQAISKGVRNKKIVAIAFIDLDGFKEVNDKYGHSIGDELLKKAADELKHVLREGDTLSRIGGDEFVAVIDDLDSPAESDAIISRMLESISQTLEVREKLLKISASIGVTYYPLDNGSPDQLLRHADQAMYAAKQNGKNCCHIFDVENNMAQISRNEELARISEALDNNEFELYYQPKIDLRSKMVVGVEALIRWNHPAKGVLPPITFLPAAENDILGIRIERWVIETALEQLDDWQKQGIKIPISVNISPLQLQHPVFFSELEKAIKVYENYQPGSFELELLESSELKDIEHVSKVIAQCAKLGVSISIDDFGAGYSSLTYLKRLPAEFLKIDQSFVRDMLTDKDDKAIIQGIIELARVFDFKVIAEGVETPEHGRQLLELGCFVAQGFGIARPMPAIKLVPWLDEWKANPEMVDGSV